MGKKKRAAEEAARLEAERLAAIRSNQNRLRGYVSAASFTPEQRRERARKAGLASAAKRAAEREAAGLPPRTGRRSADVPQPSARALAPFLAKLDELYPDREWTHEERRSEAILMLRKHTAEVQLAHLSKKTEK